MNDSSSSKLLNNFMKKKVSFTVINREIRRVFAYLVKSVTECVYKSEGSLLAQAKDRTGLLLAVSIDSC